jgi:hypothetical protein
LGGAVDEFVLCSIHRPRGRNVTTNRPGRKAPGRVQPEAPVTTLTACGSLDARRLAIAFHLRCRSRRRRSRCFRSRNRQVVTRGSGAGSRVTSPVAGTRGERQRHGQQGRYSRYRGHGSSPIGCWKRQQRTPLHRNNRVRVAPVAKSGISGQTQLTSRCGPPAPKGNRSPRAGRVRAIFCLRCLKKG